MKQFEVTVTINLYATSQAEALKVVEDRVKSKPRAEDIHCPTLIKSNVAIHKG